MPTDPSTPEPYWRQHAAQWQRIGSPLRPAPADAELYWRAISSSLPASALAGARALLLGVTPELASLQWPRESSLIACDTSRDMIRSIWPLGRFPGSFCAVVNANWLALPLASGDCQVVVGDGALTVIEKATDCRRLARELQRVLQPGGSLVLRLFCQPPVAESPEVVLADLRRGRVGGFHAFKWRLVMAMHAADENARLADVWERWESEFPLPETVATMSGWPRAAIDTLGAYRNSAARYSFFTLDAVCDLLAPEFEFVGAEYADHELGERCPIARFRRRAA